MSHLFPITLGLQIHCPVSLLQYSVPSVLQPHAKEIRNIKDHSCDAFFGTLKVNITRPLNDNEKSYSIKNKIKPTEIYRIRNKIDFTKSYSIIFR